MREKRLVGAGEHCDREGKIRSEVERSILIRSKGLNTKHQTSSHGASITGRGQSDGGGRNVVAIGVVNALSRADLISNSEIDHLFDRCFQLSTVCTLATCTIGLNGVHYGSLVKGQRLPRIV